MAYSQHRSDLISARIAGNSLILERTINGQVWHRQVGPDDYLTPMEAAVALRVHRLTVYDWLEKGLFQTYQGPNGVVLRWRDVLKFGRDRSLPR